MFSLTSAGIAYWYWASPQLTQFALLHAFRYAPEWTVNKIASSDDLSTRILEGLTPILETPAVRAHFERLGLSLEAVQMMMSFALPAFVAKIQDKKTANASSYKELRTALIASAPLVSKGLHLNQDLWSLLIQQILSGKMQSGDCRVKDARAACQLRIAVIDDKRIEVATLWTRQGFWWSFSGVSGLPEALTKLQSF